MRLPISLPLLLEKKNYGRGFAGMRDCRAGMKCAATVADAEI
ncbi:hypothetical protein [Stenotrophomonas maltophilia]|nr:hypothetical protein [Stenotrophomonas maltophilia]